MVEKTIRSVFENDPNITFKQGVELVGITEDTDAVTITYHDESGVKQCSKVIPFSMIFDFRANSS
jgi:2-polyprenyl-6-methoxyphenol hydroxylase-like FAD-dependent oxidoreductase